MDWITIIVLALIQGLTEFLPVSSSAHLLLVPLFTDWPDQGLAFDIAVHFGSLLAVIAYFRREIGELVNAWLASVFKGRHSAESRLAWAIGFATIPVGLVGILAKPVVETAMRSGVFMAYSLIGFGLLLGYADWRYSRRCKIEPEHQPVDEYHMSLWQITAIALSQALALIPGTSRSGITITAGLLVGLSREASARFSFLLSIPVIFLASILQTSELAMGTTTIDWLAVLAAVTIAAVSAYVCIYLFMGIIKKVGMQPFVIYRLALGVYLLYVFGV